MFSSRRLCRRGFYFLAFSDKLCALRSSNSYNILNLFQLNLPMHSPIPGSELTREPFRWDQRLFSLVLRLTGTPPTERDPQSLVSSDSSPIDAMCEVTGGNTLTIGALSSKLLLDVMNIFADIS